MGAMDHRPTLDEALQRREAYLRAGIPPVVIARAMAEARARRARVFHDLMIRLGRRLKRSLRRVNSDADRLQLSAR
jgi:hypothetical protein